MLGSSVSVVTSIRQNAVFSIAVQSMPNPSRYLPLLLLLPLFWSSCEVRSAAVDPAEQAITIALTQEPPSLNTLQTTDLVSFFVMGHIMEGLLRYDQRGRLVPAVAESWTMKDREVVFRLRENARWSNGRPVTADDFVFAWRKMVDPEFAAPYATILYPISNARRIHHGEMPLQSLGITAVDARTLKVTLEVPTPWFPALTVHLAYYPVPEDFYKQAPDRYATEPQNLLSNGPFKLTSWVHGASLAMERNDTYWAREKIRLAKINVGYISEDNRTRLNLFRDDAIALARLDAETVSEAVRQKLRVKTFVSGGLAFIQFNVRGTAGNLALRKAVQAIVDPEILVNNVIAVPGYKPARSFFPSWLMAAEKPFQDAYPPRPVKRGLAAAKEWMQKALSVSDGEIPPLTLLTVNSPTGMKIAEYIQGLLNRDLGLNVRIDNQTIKQYLAKARGGDFDLAVSSWYPDYDDVLTYADLLASWNPNNRGGYKNPDYDASLQQLQTATESEQRYGAASRLQDLIRDEAMVIPLMETGSAYLVHPQLKGVVRRVIGPDPDYTYARIVQPSPK